MMMRKRLQSTRIIGRLAADETGATAVEYGLFAALIALGMLGGLKLFGTSVVGLFLETNNDIVDTVLSGTSGG